MGFDFIDRAFAYKPTFVRLECTDCEKPGDTVETRSVFCKGQVVDYPMCLACWRVRIYGDDRIDAA